MVSVSSRLSRTWATITHAARSVRTREIDQQHIRLDLRFDWEKQQADGKATLTLAPFKTTKEITLDAAGMRIGVQTASTQEIWVMENLVKPGLTKESQVLKYERMDNAGLDLNAGRVDTLMLVAKPARDMAKKLNLNIAFESAETVTAGTCVGLPEGEVALKSALDRIINELKNEGWLDKKYKEFDLL